MRAFWLPSKVIFPLSYLLQLIKEEDSFSLGFSDRLHDPPDSASCFFELLHKQGIVAWQVIGRRVEVVTTIVITNV